MTVQWLRARTALREDLSSVSAAVFQLLPLNFSSTDSNTLFWPLLAPMLTCAYTQTHTKKTHNER